MELVPIVILALEIVSVLAVVVLISSYIAFKIRAKSQPEKQEFTDDFKPKFIGHGIKRLTMMTKEILPAHKPAQQIEKPSQPRRENIQPQQKEKTHSTSKIRIQKKAGKPPVELAKSHERKKSQRLEIITQMPVSPENKPEIKPIKKGKEKENLSSLGDEILKKYADDDDDSLQSLRTDRDDAQD
jgi:hypothetical protein